MTTKTIQQLHKFIASQEFDVSATKDKAEKMGLNSMNIDTAHHIMDMMKHKCFSKDVAALMEIVHFEIDCRQLVPAIYKAIHATTKTQKKCTKKVLVDMLDDIECEYSDGKMTKNEDGSYEHTEETMGSRLVDLMDEEKIIFMNIALENYFVDLDEKEKYSSHGVCAFLIPYGEEYKMFYVNSHGNDMLTTESYEIYVTRRRRKMLNFEDPIDIEIMKVFTQWMGEEWERPIVFKNEDNQVYYGVNLQIGDSDGTCYIFPWIIYYYLGRFYDQKRRVKVGKKSTTIPAIATLLMKGQLEKAIHYMFMDYCPAFKKMLITKKPKSKSVEDEEQFTYAMEEIIELNGDSFVHALVYTVVMFIEQAL